MSPGVSQLQLYSTTSGSGKDGPPKQVLGNVLDTEKVLSGRSLPFYSQLY